MDTRAPILSRRSMDRFIDHVLSSQAVWAVKDENGLARVASGLSRSTMVTLLWSEQPKCERWQRMAAGKARVKCLSLADLLVDVLPKLAELGRLVGPDRGAHLVDIEIEPAELARRLRVEAVLLFARRVTRLGSVWLLQGPDGPACLSSQAVPGRLLLPCWHDRTQAEMRLQGPLADMVVSEVPIETFRKKTLLWAAESGRLAAPAFCEGKGVIELEPDELERQLAAAGSSLTIA
jgi:hypothetical protein